MSSHNSNPPNRLSKSSSPYLQQHAHNPVDWYEWGTEALAKARAENKPLLISIGYSACHWCHVMAHEVFEDQESAQLMNTHFINIKIDREERSDIDQIYMDAIQLLTGRGGWPLNIFALPDGRPFHGGTYFPKKDWDSILNQLADLWQNKPETVYEYAEKLTFGLKSSSNPVYTKSDWTENDFHNAMYQIQTTWDLQFGGFNRAPKFPLPVVYKFALHYFHLFHQPQVLDWIVLSLKKMSLGGLYDTVGGGYSRYSVDNRWFAPHFEKMLYDNAQLLSILAETYMVTGDSFLLDRINKTHQFLQEEWLSDKGGLYSALDADSEGDEGKYYCYTWDELERIGLPHEDVISYFNLTPKGNWEHGKNILFATLTPQEFASSQKLIFSEFERELNLFISNLHLARKQRVKPGLDDKILTSWNALAITGLLKCYQATGDKRFLNTAQTVIDFIDDNLWQNNQLFRNYKNEKAVIPAFLEDYVMLAEALTLAYQLTFNTNYLLKANQIVQVVIDQFSQENSPFFIFNPDPKEELFIKKTDLGDDVIPSANSVLCELLIKHSFYFNLPRWMEMADQMLQSIRSQALQGPAWYCNWLGAALLKQMGVNQLTLNTAKVDWPMPLYLPNTIFVKPDAEIPISKEKMDAQSNFYLCRDFECFAPENNLGQLIDRLF